MNGLLYTWPDGRKAGVAYDSYQTFLQNRDQYIAMGKEFPRSYVIDTDTQGNYYEFKFSYDDPFNPVSFRLISLPLVTPAGVLIDEGENLSEEVYITEPLPNYPLVITPTVTPTITPTVTPTITPTVTPGAVDIIQIGSMTAMAGIALAMIFGKSRHKRKNA